MAGELVPLVMAPRFSTYSSSAGDAFTTIAMDVTEYEKAIVNFWMNLNMGTSPVVTVTFQESTDQVNWTTCGGSASGTPAGGVETQYIPTISKRWFRLHLSVTGTNVVFTCWAVGFLEERQS
jgi:hypothetical protein